MNRKSIRLFKKSSCIFRKNKLYHNKLPSYSNITLHIEQNEMNSQKTCWKK